MASFFASKVKNGRQYLISLLLVLVVATLCYALSAYMGYQVVALILLVTVSVIAVCFDIFPVLLAALASACIWDFFFIPPRYNFHVSTTEDTILLIMYFIIAMVNAVLTFRVRMAEKNARKKEERSNTIKLYNTLLNSLSHELRTPIATIIGATDNLQANNTKLTEQNKDRLIVEISKAAFRLNRQVENLLNMSRLESGFIKPRKDWCDVNEVVYETVRKIEDNKITQRITININPGLPLFKTDKDMLEQIIYNLLNNACLYTQPDAWIHISAISHADILQLIIEDDGPGFPQEEIQHVFDKFYRLKNAKAGGTGLGLSIVKGFTEALDGSVQLENITRGGARFTIEMPCETSWLKVD